MRYGLSDGVIAELQDVFRKFPNIAEVRIFGSRAKGCYTPGSDIDLALTGTGPIDFDEMMDIKASIDDLLLLYKVDVVDYRKVAGTPIAGHIDRVGQPFYTK